MKSQLKTSLVICAIAGTALWSGGCAKQQVVKPDPVVPPAASAAPAAPAKPATVAQRKADPKEIGLSGGAIKEAGAADNAESARTSAPVSQALEKVYFDFDSYALSPQARESLTRNVDILKKDAQAKIRIEGHCDELGSDDYNLALGERRANAARNYLQSMGVGADRLSIISYGKEKPADPGHDEAARAKNRRDEFVVSSK